MIKFNKKRRTTGLTIIRDTKKIIKRAASRKVPLYRSSPMNVKPTRFTPVRTPHE